jgi:hypothetical protein
MIYLGTDILNRLFYKIFDVKLPKDNRFNITGLFYILQVYLIDPNLPDSIIYQRTLTKQIRDLKRSLGNLTMTIENDDFRKKYTVHVISHKYKKKLYELKIDLHYDKYILLDFYRNTKGAMKSSRALKDLPWNYSSVMEKNDYIHLIIENPSKDKYSTDSGSWVFEYNGDIYNGKMILDNDDLSINANYHYKVDNKTKKINLTEIGFYFFDDSSMATVNYIIDSDIYKPKSRFSSESTFKDISVATCLYMNDSKISFYDLDKDALNVIKMIAV